MKNGFCIDSSRRQNNFNDEANSTFRPAIGRSKGMGVLTCKGTGRISSKDAPFP
jgi:hypothetical protein